MTSRLVRPTLATRVSVIAAVSIIGATLIYLIGEYAGLPDILPVRFGRHGDPIGWQYRTVVRVMMPVFVQLALMATLGAVGGLLLTRPHGEVDRDAPDVRAAGLAAEAVALIALTWISFQGYVAFALSRMWKNGHDGLGTLYTVLELTGAIASVVIFARAHLLIGRPVPRPFVPEHWRYGQLYRNPHDPALFVQTRDGSRWTLNFGRPVAAALMGLLLAVGMVGPALILSLLLR